MKVRGPLRSPEHVPTTASREVSVRIIAGVTLLATAAACAPPPGEQQTEDTAIAVAEDIEAVRAVRDAEVASAISGDTVLAHLADEVLVMPPNEPLVVGIDAVREWHRSMNAAYVIDSLEYVDSEVEFADNIAVETYTGRLVVTPVAGGEPLTDVIKGVHIYERQADGSWKLTKDVWNSDLPVGGAQ
jgi:ketosteroid isomerase-like protein